MSTKEIHIDLNNVVMKTNLPHKILKRGKVRDVYDLGNEILIISTDRISAFDVVLPNGIPLKGKVLNLISAYWFRDTKSIVNNHMLKVVDSRTILAKKTNPLKVEFIVRGFLYGSAWERYRKGEDICGVRLPTNIKKAEKLPQPIFTPTIKADEGHDTELTKEEVIKIIGEDLTNEIEELSTKIYEYASKKAESRGIIIADTKFEFGIYDDEILLIDEVLTPDSSRFWPNREYELGKNQPSFDKQYVRDYLMSIKWNKNPPPPILPDNVVIQTSLKYMEAYEMLIGNKFVL